ncbi:hypothetical protein [Streptomyces kronopolitis]|uniref:hypothetical protein n=1 Tax=Streptomyces kronopolitis TaxID=1612435 RepID=UPI00341D7F46
MAWPRIAKSADPARFKAVLDRTTAELEDGTDLLDEPWSPVDPVRLAAEIEALASARRLNSVRKDSK